VCGVHKSETPISKRGLCQKHGRALLVANNDQLERKSGPFYDHWERRSLLWARRLLVARQARLDNIGQEG
jgi:hypothetical protein